MMKKFTILLAFLTLLPTYAGAATQNGTNNVAAAGSLTGSTLAAGVTGSSLTSVGTIGTGTWHGTAIDNPYILHPATTVNGQTCTLGSTCTVTAAATGVTVGTTTVGGGTNTRVEFNNAGVLGEYAISGTGSVCMTTGCAMTTPNLGTPSDLVATNATGTAPALNIGGNAGTAGDLLSEPKITGTSKSIKTEYQTVAGNATQTLFDYSGSGYVSSVFMAVGYTSAASVSAGTINIYIDGSGSPSISMAADLFFENQYMENSASPNAYFNNKFFGANCNGTTNTNCSFYSKMPIPFGSEVKITYTNGSASAITFWSVATIQTGVANTWHRTRHFYAVNTLIDAPSANATETLLNVAPGVNGRLAGIWMLDDEFPHTMNPVGASWEGNFRFYADNFTKVWAASTAYSVNDTIIDSNGNLQTVTSVSSDAKTGGSPPTWSQVSGATTADNHVTWTQTPGTPNQVWRASRPFALNMAVIDTNGNVQMVTTAGTTNSSVPSWNVTPGGTTADNTVTWTNQGSVYASSIYQSSGSEDLFMMGFYGQGVPAMTSSSGIVGTTFCNTSPLSPTSVTRSMYRFFFDDPINFTSSLAITWQAGDTSQVSWTSGSPKVWITVYYYTE